MERPVAYRQPLGEVVLQQGYAQYQQYLPPPLPAPMPASFNHSVNYNAALRDKAVQPPVLPLSNV
jgi:hypothetical protein